MSQDFVAVGQSRTLHTQPQLQIQKNQGHFQNPLKKSTQNLSKLRTASSSSKAASAKSTQNKFQYLFSSSSESSLDTQVQSVNGSSNFVKNTRSTAHNIGDFSGKSGYTWNDKLDSSNSDDFFKFSLSNRSRVSLSLGNLEGSANLRLLKANGTQIKKSTGSSISSSLRSGDYYVQVSSDGATYSLNMKGSGIANDAGTATRSALDAGELTRSNRTFRRMIGGKDKVDVYRFDLSEKSSVELALGNLKKDASLHLLDGQGNEIDLSDSSGNTGESITKQLGAGTYYVKVETASKSGMRYALEMNTGEASSSNSGFDFGSNSGSNSGSGSSGGSSGSGSSGGSSGSGSSGGNSGGGSGSGSGSSSNNTAPYLRLSKTNRTTSTGLVELQLELIKGNKAVDQVVTVSGQPGKQAFKLPSQSKSGSMEPLPEGKWSLGVTEWAAGKNNLNASWGEGLGPMWVSVEPLMSTSRSAIGIHLDSNSSYAPGTVGCIGVTNKTDLQRVASWFDNSLAPKTLIVDWGLGTVAA
ncbi:MAG TPA: PPC domain-containing protein [Coleofasciculaceae cyanobacterium]